MTIYEWIILVLGLIIVIPILAFLIMKSGTVGFYRGKEASQSNVNATDVNIDNKNEETEKF